MIRKSLLCAVISAAFCSLAQAANSNPFENAEDKILEVQCEDSSGAGFICEMDGKRYFITCIHVISGQRRIAAFFGNGEKLRFGRMEIAENGDLVRFAVASNLPAFKLAAAEPEKHGKIRMLGNNGGKHIRLDGRILETGNGRAEISARFTHRDVGAPVLNENGEVAGAAAFEVRGPAPEDWIKTGAPRIRRFALDLRNRNWKRTDPALFCRKTKAEEKKAREKAGIFPQARAVFKSPSMRINKNQQHGETEYFINGNIVLGLSDIKGIKNPVVRLAVLVEGSNQTVFDAVSDEPGGKFAYSCVPIDSYGMPKSGRSFNVGNDISAYYLEGISFYQPTSKLASLPGGGKNIEYFDRSFMLSGGFRIPDDAVKGETAPKIVAYRLECWQNGSLAGVYDSMRPDTLNSKDIPVDWFVIGRYPEKFIYAGNCRYGRY